MPVSGSPYNACVSIRPARARRLLVGMLASHARIRTGAASAGASTVRADVGVTHKVATDTATKTWLPTPIAAGTTAGRGAGGGRRRLRSAPGVDPQPDSIAATAAMAAAARTPARALTTQR